MDIKLTVVCENSVERVAPEGLLAEHGFACHLQIVGEEFLFDTGGGLGLLNNCDKLDINLAALQGVILSHGHRDHTGGLRALLSRTGEIPVHAHPDLFRQRYSSNAGQLREIGCPWAQSELEAEGARFQLHCEPRQLTAQLTVSGEISRGNSFETGDQNLVIQNDQGRIVTDPLRDDLSLYLNTDQGLVIILGCAHAGLFNIIEHARSITGQQKIHMLLGGTHLKFSTEAQLETTLERLGTLDIERIGVSHCTGLRQAQKLAERFGQRFFFATVGTEILVPL